MPRIGVLAWATKFRKMEPTSLSSVNLSRRSLSSAKTTIGPGDGCRSTNIEWISVVCSLESILDDATNKNGSHVADLKRELFEATSYYSPDYFTARRRFLESSNRLGLEHHSLPINAP